MSIKMKCPHCSSPAVARSAVKISPLVHEIVFRCDDDYCGFSFLARLEASRTIKPSANPDPDIVLPMSPHRRRAAVSGVSTAHTSSDDDARENVRDVGGVH